MGFSISGSFAIVAFATFVAAGVLVPTAINTVGDINQAQQTVDDNRLFQQNTEIGITRAEWIEHPVNGDRIIVEVENTGSTTLNINETDILVDNTYFAREDFSSESVGGNEETELWNPGETYEFEIPGGLLDDLPLERVKIITEFGVSDSENVTGG